MNHSAGTRDMLGMNHQHGGTVDPAPDRPLGLVLGSFGAGSAAVMASAAFVRRRDSASRSARHTHAGAPRARS